MKISKGKGAVLGEVLKSSTILGAILAQEAVQAVFHVKTGLVPYLRDT